MHPLPMTVPDDDARLAEACAALASATRVALLREVRVPKTLAEIQVRPDEPDADRNIARQVVRRHLDKLIEVGLVRTRGSEETRSTEFVLDNQTLYALAEEVLDLARIRPAVEPDAPTVVAPRRAPAPSKGPSLVLVRGLEPGLAYPLRDADAWIVGRKRGVAVALDFDPFVSAENARIARVSGRFLLEDLPGSRNGTFLNFERLAPGERAPLEHGDVVGVGRSILVYRA